MASPQSEISALLDRRSDTIRTKDIDRLLSFYSPDVVYFDLVPPLQYVGSDALRGRFQHWFDSYHGSIGQDIHDLTISAGEPVAIASMLIRSGGTLKNGNQVEFWVRATSVLRQSNDGWLIAHEHISLPVDVATGRAVTDLKP
jgi:ketosteroid isomerase-like protein